MSGLTPGHGGSTLSDMTTYTDQQLEDWASIFGACAGANGWWSAICHHDGGDWETPSRVTLAIENPDYEAEVPVSKTLEPADIFAALDTATERYPWLFKRHPEYGDLDLDASSSDVVLQVALLGDVVYG